MGEQKAYVFQGYPMVAKLITYIPYAELNGGKPSTLAEFQAELSKFDRKSVLYVCAVVNCLLKLWRAGHVDIPVHDVLLESSFPPELAPRLIKFSRDEQKPRFLFHRQQALFVLKEALTYCRDTGGQNPLNTPYWGGLGLAFLMANDHLHYVGPAEDVPDARIVQLISDFIPVLESSGWHGFESKIIRSYLMLHKFSQELIADPQAVDICRVFESSLGISAFEYQALTFGALSKYLEVDLDAFRADPKSFLLPRTWFRTTPVLQEHVDRWLELTAASPEQLRASFEKRDTGHSDFTWLRDRPLVQDEGAIYAIDPAFLAEKIETGVFWGAFNALGSGAEKERMHAFWGKVFERYANRLLEDAVDGTKNHLVTKPKFIGTDDEVCDAVIFCGSSVVLMEHKGSTFTARAKYGGERELLRSEIESKLVGTESARKGVRQLASAIQRLFFAGEKIEGVDVGGVTKIVPALVTRDDIGGTLLINLYLQRRFRNVLRGSVKPRILTPLFCLSAEALEGIAGYLKQVRLDDILEARYRGEPKMMSTFLAVDNEAIKGVEPKRPTILKNALEEFTSKSAKFFFPSESIAVAGH